VLISLRVDASVLPIQLSAHLSATLYGFAEKAAETILLGE
jgi:choline dehydrogenase